MIKCPVPKIQKRANAVVVRGGGPHGCGRGGRGYGPSLKLVTVYAAKELVRLDALRRTTISVLCGHPGSKYIQLVHDVSEVQWLSEKYLRLRRIQPCDCCHASALE